MKKPSFLTAMKDDMNKSLISAAVMTLFFALSSAAYAETFDFETYVTNFDYAARKEMKMSSAELIEAVKSGTAVLVDIRFKEEHQVWNFGFGMKIPLNELPARLAEIPKDKIIVTACPHNDRANIARLYLLSKGYKAKYLEDGLLSLAEALRGDAAKKMAESVK